jgi:hypothetical protein
LRGCGRGSRNNVCGGTPTHASGAAEPRGPISKFSGRLKILFSVAPNSFRGDEKIHFPANTTYTHIETYNTDGLMVTAKSDAKRKITVTVTPTVAGKKGVTESKEL